jgi:hypothetical protein
LSDGGRYRVGMTFKAATLNVSPSHSTFNSEMHHAMRLERLRIRHGIHGPVAAAIAALAFDGGRQR